MFKLLSISVNVTVYMCSLRGLSVCLPVGPQRRVLPARSLNSLQRLVRRITTPEHTDLQRQPQHTARSMSEYCTHTPLHPVQSNFSALAQGRVMYESFIM